MHHGISHMVGSPPEKPGRAGERSGGVHSPLDIRPGEPFFPPDIRPGDPPLVTPGGDHWRPLQTCSFGDPPAVTSGSGN